MFFTKIGKLTAFSGFGFGVLREALGFAIAFGASDIADNAAATQA